MTSGLTVVCPIIAILDRWGKCCLCKGFFVHRKDALQNPKAMFFAALFALSGKWSSVTILTLTN
jgi:hypothetical protein